MAVGLDHDLPEARTAALGAALRLGTLTEDLLIPFFADPSVEVRYRAVEVTPALLTTLGELNTPATTTASPLVENLLQALDDPELAEVAAFALGELSLDPTKEQLVGAALAAQSRGHDDALAREAAVAALGSLGLEPEAVLEATSDIATVRRRAVLALAPFEGPEIDAALLRALDDRDWQVRQAAEDLGATELLPDDGA